MNRPTLIDLRFLRQIAQHRARRHANFSLLAAFTAQDQTRQSRFAHAIFADQHSAIAPFQIQVDRVENQLGAVKLLQAADVQDL